MTMAESIFDSVSNPVPGTPGIREVRSDENYQVPAIDPVFLGPGGIPSPNPSGQGIRKVGLRAEIDTSPPFGSVKEAVTRFGGSGPWIPYYKLGENYNGDEEFDIKRVEEQAAELEKDLIVKELQTLDILEELNTNKRIVEDLKRHLQQEASKCSTPNPDFHLDTTSTPHIKEMTNETASSSPEMILMELKQAKMNLGKTINDLGGIQTSVESLNKRMKKEKSLIERTCERLTSKFMGNAVGPSLEEQLKHARIKPPMARHGRIDIPTAEMRWVAAKKMEEAARATEALAMAEIKALSSNGSSSGFFLPEPLLSSLQSIGRPEGLPRKKFAHGLHQLGEANISKLAMFRKLEEATEEVLQSKHALDEALSRVEIVNQKQIAVEEALRKWIPRSMYNPAGTLFDFDSSHIHPQHYSPLNFVDKSSIVSDEPKPILRSTVSMRDILRKKPVLTAEEFASRDQNEGRKVALSQMLNELKGDLTYHPKSDQKDEKNDHPKQMFTQRRKFGFIHISLPLTRQSKKKMQDQFKSQNRMMGE